MEDINQVLRAGADKISINTAAINNPNFINQASRFFGSSTIVVSIECIRQNYYSVLAYTDNGREHTGKNVFEWAKEAEDRGAGEILLTSIDKDGTGKGFDVELIRLVSNIVNIPVIAHGGASNVEDIIDAIQIGGADAIAIASMLHYSAKSRSSVKAIEFEGEGNIEFLKKNNSYKVFGDKDLKLMKVQISNHDIPLRVVE